MSVRDWTPPRPQAISDQSSLEQREPSAWNGNGFGWVWPSSEGNVGIAPGEAKGQAIHLGVGRSIRQAPSLHAGEYAVSKTCLSLDIGVGFPNGEIPPQIHFLSLVVSLPLVRCRGLNLAAAHWKNPTGRGFTPSQGFHSGKVVGDGLDDTVVANITLPLYCVSPHWPTS